MPHTNKTALLKRRPSWNDKPRYGDDKTLRTFVWPYGTGELIDELKRVREILTLSDKIEAARPIEIEIAFEECFIDSHEMLMMLMDRLTDAWNSRALFDILNITDNSFDGVSVAYKTANLLFQTTTDKFLRMRHLYEQLKPETRSLIKKCSGPTQLERSMIAQKKEPVQTISAASVFQPACGFTLKAPATTNKIENQETGQKYKDIADVQVAPKDRLAAIDVQIERLLQEKNTLVQKLQDFEIRKVELEMYEVLHNMIAKGNDIQDPVLALQYANDTIAPQKHIINLNSKSFNNILQALPKSYPSSWTCEDASHFFLSVSGALEEDFKTLLVSARDADARTSE